MIKKLIFNLKNSINGLRLALSESSFILELVGGIILTIYLFLSDLNFIHEVLITIVYILLLAFELLNTAIEKLCDKINKEIDKDIKAIKDISSSAVFIVLILLILLIILTFFT
ncbi:diacylglycerol kinase [Candidatus Pelagibacter ubique]|jgi:diacylglycerol kinase|nr:diacylglycerol kinase [Candidatus Pelagibacter ubique]